jgi:hypothetical protein
MYITIQTMKWGEVAMTMALRMKVRIMEVCCMGLVPHPAFNMALQA